MKLLLSAITASLLLCGCRKINQDMRVTPGSIQNTTPAEAPSGDLFMCTVPSAAEFPGGTAAWHQFLQKNLLYPAEAVDEDLEGTVIVLFTVDTDGTLSDIKAISGPDELKQSAIEVVQKSPKWIPSKSNGQLFKDYRRQPIAFRLEE